MEQKLVRVPFDVELAKKITNKEIEGRIFDNHYKCPARIVDFNFQTCKGKLNVVISKEVGKEVFVACNDEGTIFLENEGKFDKKPIFMLEIPEYLTFKDGDIIACGWEGQNESSSWISIVKSVTDDVCTNDYVTLIVKSNNHSDGLLMYDDFTTSGEWIRSATEEEKQKLIDALKDSKEPKAKEYLKRFFGIEEKFKPFDKVLVRCNDELQWSARFFERIYEGDYACTDSLVYKQCIPYNEQTAHLLGTTDDWEG